MIEENTGNFSASRHLYDWFQNTSHVIINIMIKNLRESDVRVRLIDDTLDVSCSLANGNLFKLHFNLFKPIYVTESSWSVTPSKLEVKLKKTDRKRWQSLETIPEKGAKRTPAVAGIVEANSPTAKKFAAAMSASDNQPKSDGKPKYDWYQTELYVVVTVMIRNLNADNVNIDYGEQTADLTCKLENDSEYTLNLKLSNPIIPKESSFKVTSSKVELKMKKVDTVRWESLELSSNSTSKHELCNVAGNIIQQETTTRKDEQISPARTDSSNTASESDKSTPKTVAVNKPPNFYAKNWDKIVNDFEEEEKTGEGQSIDELLKDIYNKGNEETRRAISKSFQESNGTVLSTNWKEVSQSKVDVKPPDGCEFRSWQS